MREHLEQVARQTGRVPSELEDEPAIPACVETAWVWFFELNRARSGTGLGINPLSYAEISAWSELTGNRPAPFELRVIRALDEVYLEHNAS